MSNSQTLIDGFRNKVIVERTRQREKWGKQEHSAPIWHAILSEEIGEVAKALLETDFDALETELVQCAAVIEAWIEHLYEVRDNK